MRVGGPELSSLAGRDDDEEHLNTVALGWTGPGQVAESGVAAEAAEAAEGRWDCRDRPPVR
jgi:hypothetical protein